MMADDKRKVVDNGESKAAVNAEPDADRFYKVLSGYVTSCIKGDKTADNIELQKSDRKELGAMYDEIADKGIPYLVTYVDTLKRLYEDHSDWKRDLQTILTQGKSLMLFRDARSSIIDLYPVLVTVNKTFKVDDYVELSLSPRAAMYGSEMNKTQKGSTKRAPMENEEYQAMLDTFLHVKDYKRFADWLMAILVFTPEQMVDEYQPTYIPKREQLKEWAYRQINNDKNYRHIVIDTLLKKRNLAALMDAFVAMPGLEKKQESLEDEIKRLQEASEQERAEHDERRAKQYETIQQLKAENEELRKRVREYDRCQEQLTDYIDKYKTQVSMNERITVDNDRRLQEMESDYDRMADELDVLKDQLDELSTSHAALQADYGLKNNELQRLRDMSVQKEDTARVSLMQEFISGVNDQLYYLTMFYLELRDTGRLEPESIELYADTLQNIDGVLAELGISKIGTIDQIVEYDASIHKSTDARLSNGDKAIVRGYGWKIGDEVYIKAPVEKEGE